MRIDAYFTIPEVETADIADRPVVVVDVVRATTTIIEALANGARAIYPTTSTEDAVRLASSLGREDTILCGERKGLKVEGFDLGNSPRENTRPAVTRTRLDMRTTNGTPANETGGDGDRLVPCALTNLGAVAKTLKGVCAVTILCSGREDHFSLEDALCAGLLIARLQGEPEVTPILNDASRAARALADSLQPDRAFLSETAAGRALIKIGLGDDLDICAQVDRHVIVPEMRDQAITLSKS
jgi:2-phosphosulfolactate phosphatase